LRPSCAWFSRRSKWCRIGRCCSQDAAQLANVVPFLVEDELKRLGGLDTKGPNWGPFVQVGGNLITGQNPASSAPAARATLELFKSREALEAVS